MHKHPFFFLLFNHKRLQFSIVLRKFNEILALVPFPLRGFSKPDRYGIITEKRLLYLCIPVSASTAEIRALKSAGGYHGPQRHGIITTTWLLCLCIPVSAFTAEIRALSSAGGYHGPQGHGIMSLAELRACTGSSIRRMPHRADRRDGIITAKRSTYKRKEVYHE